MFWWSIAVLMKFSCSKSLNNLLHNVYEISTIVCGTVSNNTCVNARRLVVNEQLNEIVFFANGHRRNLWIMYQYHGLLLKPPTTHHDNSLWLVSMPWVD